MELADETFPGAWLFALSLGTAPAAFGLTIASAAAVVDKVTGGNETGWTSRRHRCAGGRIGRAARDQCDAAHPFNLTGLSARSAGHSCRRFASI